jgi:hypothetical protein
MAQPALPYVLIATALLIGLTQRLYALCCDPHDRLRRAVCLLLGGLLAATVAQLFAEDIDKATGVLHLGAALSDAGAMTTACAGRLFLLYLDHAELDVRRRALRRYAGLGAALAAAAVLFVLFPPRPGQENPVYLIVYIGYLVNVLVATCRLGIRYSGRTYRPFLRVGLRVLAVAGATGLAFLAVETTILIRGLYRLPPGEPLDTIGLCLELLTETLLLAGVTIPTWGSLLGDALRWILDYRSYLGLRPLWLALREAEPEFVLLPETKPAQRWLPRDVGLLLYRQVIEIRDGQLALRRYTDPSVTEQAGRLAHAVGLAPSEVRAVVEASGIAAGIAAKASGRPAVEPAGAGRADPGRADLAEEIALLRGVAKALRRSPIVAEAVRAAV